MGKRWYLSPVIGSGSLDDPYRAQIATGDLAHAALIPTKPDGTPRFDWCLVRVAASDLSGFEADARLFSFSDDLDTPLSKLTAAQRTKIATALQKIGITPKASQTRRELLTLIGQSLEPTFAESRVDMPDPDEQVFPRIGGGALGANFVQDSFTDTNGTNLESHTGELGATWVKMTGQTGTVVITGNTAHGSTSARAMYRASGASTTADMEASVDFTNSITSPSMSAGPMVRASSSAATAYLAFLGSSANVTIYKVVASAFTSIGSATFTQTVSTAYTIKLSAVGTTIGVYKNGVFSASVTDSAITTGLFAGFEVTGGNGNDRVFDNFLAFDPNASSGTNHALAGTSAGIGNQTGALSVAIKVAGTSAGIGAATGALSVAIKVAGTSSGVGDQTGALRLANAIAGTSAGIGDQTGSLRLAVALSGTSAGIGSQTGALALAVALAGTSAGIGGQAGALSVAIGLAGTSDGTGDQTGAVSIAVLLAGTSAGLGDQIGTLTLTAGLAGVSDGIGDQSGALTVVAHIAADGTLTANVQLFTTLTATSELVDALSATLTMVDALTATIALTDPLAASLTIDSLVTAVLELVP